jgi:hypothetical protein
MIELPGGIYFLAESSSKAGPDSRGSAARMTDFDVLKQLSKSIVLVGLLMWAADFALHRPTIQGSVQWCSLVMLLHAFYNSVLECSRFCRCRAAGRGPRLVSWELSRRQVHQSTYMDLPQMPPAGDSPPPEHLELNPGSVYTYVYGWGILLFVCLYCMAGQIESSSCWWVVGMLVLAFDELIARNVMRFWVATIGALLYTSVVSLWWAASGSKAVEQHLDGIIFGVVFPVLVPFIFFSLRSPVRVVLQDVRALYDTAMPFIIIISIGVLVGTGGLEDYFALPKHSTRLLHLPAHNSTTSRVMETPAPFRHGASNPHSNQSSYFQALAEHYTLLSQTANVLQRPSLWKRLVILATPLIAEQAIITLTTCVMQGFVTEFISSFVLALTVKFALTREHTAASGLALGAAGVCFVMLILLRRVI